MVLECLAELGWMDELGCFRSYFSTCRVSLGWRVGAGEGWTSAWDVEMIREYDCGAGDMRRRRG